MRRIILFVMSLAILLFVCACANSGYIGLDKAKSIALDDIGITENDTDFSDAQLNDDDKDNAFYEVRLNENGNSHVYKIDAKTGDIIDKSDGEGASVSTNARTSTSSSTQAFSERGSTKRSAANGKSDATANSSAVSDMVSTSGKNESDGSYSTSFDGYIGAAVAELIALEYTGVDKADARFIEREREFDNDKGVYFYDLKFSSFGVRYELMVRADTGEILNKQKPTNTLPTANEPD